VAHGGSTQQYSVDREFCEWAILPTVASPNLDSTISKATGLVTTGALTGTFTIKALRYDGEANTATITVT
jgi:hypothetical protein